jgi:NAD(P)-dependent dehydrogenase (short-subunit alcohol dehydrogenase family)
MEQELVTALVTGANRGLGRQFAAGLVARGAKVYAAARRPETIDLPGVVPIQLDITDPESVRRAADTATDVTVLVNNAGISTRASLLSGSLGDVRLEMETHYFGTLNVSRAFVPIIEGNGGGAILNVLSVLSWVHPPRKRRLLRGQSSGLGVDRCATPGARAAWHPRGWPARRLHGHRDGQLCPGGPEDRSRRDRHAGARRPVRGRAGNPCRRPDREAAAVRQSPRALTNRHGRCDHQQR